ncbi:hypothetical protein OVA14_03535 [Agrococcus sp. SL85]|uniref:hypothetical protein n=1 Tax=Agrococcus sp. SL85 TaxID=2995141 RepID=UPI00226D2032|nr:hypothetical protein [Agrococcus sp. SL85]WAC66855.1 hypothetical protein OVA14_03535 [Agrococcus sp. SL85]
MASAEQVDEARGLAILLHRAATLARDDFARAARPLGIEPQAARVLLLLDEPMPLRAIADRLLAEEAVIAAAADALERAGLAVRDGEPDAPALSPTEAGAAVRERLGAAIAADSTALHALDPAERAQLATLLERLVESGAR